MKKLAAFMLALLIAGASTGAVFAYLTSQDSVNNNITSILRKNLIRRKN